MDTPFLDWPSLRADAEPRLLELNHDKPVKQSEARQRSSASSAREPVLPMASSRAARS
jgi:hypothetical protein